MDNYDSSQVGVPYVRAPRIDIRYPEPTSPELPSATIEQVEAVTLADKTIAKLRDKPTLVRTFDLVKGGSRMIPLVDPTTGAPLAAPIVAALSQLVASGNINLQLMMLALLAVVRDEQLKVLE